ncbi:uncharacterized protein LODBEIA_P01120 [Lodderomyces beijingensis]|uniref:Replication factor C subunit 1 n=1 Tax=Lodderomyces beijingensis TaxID=1775926 RepID=A0ABP0ZCI4_9ASCO
MVDIREFFGNQKSGTKRKPEQSQPAPASKRAKPQAMPKQEVIELLDDDDDFEFDDDDDEEDDDNDDDGYDDEEDDDFSEVKQTPKQSRAKSSSPRKPAPKSQPKTSPKKKAPAKDTASSKKTKHSPEVAEGDENIVEKVLASIPDAELPEVDDSVKINYFAQKAQQQQTPATDPSAVQLPEAKPYCLSGLTIIFTGQLPRLDRNLAETTAQRYGAKVTKAISKKTSLVVIGADAGPSKVKKIKEFGIKAIDEDGFIQLLESMPADGGTGKDARKAKLAREEQERKVIEDAEEADRMEREEEEKLEKERKEKEKLEAKRRQDASAQQKSKVANGASSQSSSSRSQPPPSASSSSLPVREVAAKEKLWTDKHAPKDFSQLCGNKGQVQKLRSWLEHWFENKAKGYKVGQSDRPESYRACLISGPPGIGKTTAAHMVANSLGFDVLEKNASDVRSKKMLNEKIKSLLGNTSVVGFFKHQHDHEDHANARKICLIMDEVDGMSSGDHGGAGALSQFCRITETPLILICNDKSLPKMRVFDKVALDLPFRRPSENEVKSRLMTIALREGVKLDPTIIGQLVQATSNDIRQMITLLSTVSKTQKHIGVNNAQEIQAWKKQVILKPFDIAGRLLSSGIWTAPHQNTNEKLDLYFNDIDFAPLMIQENYLNTRPRLAGAHIKHVAQAADDISASDSINSLIRSSEQQWSLLPFHGLMSTVKPSYETAGQMTGRLNFSSWLGQNSKQMKYQRMLQELQYHTRIRTSTTKQELRLDYMTPLWEKLNAPIKKLGEAGIDETIATLDEYYLTKEDFDNIADMLREPINLDTKAKTAFTRKYNSATHPTVIYKTGNSLTSGGKRAAAPKVDYEDVVDDDMEDVADDNEEEDSDKIDTKKDKLIKQKASTTKRSATSKAKGAPAKREPKNRPLVNQ